MITDSIKSLLASDPSLSSSVDGRLYPAVLPRGYTYPAICYHLVNNPPSYDVAGETGSKTATIQIDCYGSSATSARNVANEVIAVLSNFTGVLDDGSVVEGSFIERDMDMPFIPTGDAKGISYRVLIQVRFEYQQLTRGE